MGYHNIFFFIYFFDCQRVWCFSIDKLALVTLYTLPSTRCSMHTDFSALYEFIIYRWRVVFLVCFISHNMILAHTCENYDTLECFWDACRYSGLLGWLPSHGVYQMSLSLPTFPC